MVNLTDIRVDRLGFEKYIDTSVCGFSEIHTLNDKGPFNLIFSNFGGLNCIDSNSMAMLSMALRKMLKPGGSLIIVLMGRKCWWESLYFLLKGNPKEAFRRKNGGPVEANVGDKKILTWYYDPQEYSNLFSNQFKTKVIKPVGIALPPSYMDSIFSKRKWLMNWLTKCENRFHNKSYLAKWSDHYLIHLEAI